MDPMFLAVMLVTVIVAWSINKFKRHRDRLFKLVRLIEHPVIIKNINDNEMVESISTISRIEHTKMTLFWVPVGYALVVVLSILMFLHDNGNAETFIPFAAFAVAGYITAAFRFNFQPVWLVSAAMIVNKASLLHKMEQTMEQVVESLLKQFERIDGDKAAMQAEIDKIETDPHARKRFEELSNSDNKDVN